MSYKNPSPKRYSRLSTPVRLGVAAVAACFIAGPVLSNPINPTVVNGTATFNQAGNVLTVTNSNGAIVNWDKFSIKAGETTHFAQPAASSAVLNRVLNDPTAIYGTLSSNGRVWLVNPAGIMVGPGGRVDTAGFVASTLAVRNEDFLAGRHLFVNDGRAQNVINQGEIRTPAGGSVYLIGTNVSNEGIITTPQGETILASGATVSLIDSATPGVKVDITGAEGKATNLGQITAEAGRIGIAGVIVRNSGQLSASSVVSEGGRIFLKASQDAYVDKAGRIVTTGTKGGSVEVLGNRVAVTDDAGIDASGANAGGSIKLGGDYQGKNPDIRNASITYFGPKASLKADATEMGAGGAVIVWADDTTRAYGNISARSGANGGNGGFVETSGKRYLDVSGVKVDTRAANGSAGTWLLDPTDITIQYGSAPLNPGFSLIGLTSTIADYDINTALQTTNVTIVTASAYGGNGDITFDASGGAIVISNPTAAARIVNFNAERDIKFVGGSTTFQSPSSTSLMDVGLNPVGKVTTAPGASVNLDGNLGLTRIWVAPSRTWENYGTLSLTNNAALHINHNDPAGSASTLHNMSGGIVNVASTQPWAIWSNGCCQDGILVNDGTINVTASTAFEAAYSQNGSGVLNIADTKFLNLQNAIAMSGSVNLNATGTLSLNENHGTPAALSNLNFPGSGGSLNVTGGKTVNFSNVDAGNVMLYVGTPTGGTVNVFNGYAVFKSLSMDGGTLGAVSNGAFGIAYGSFTIPNGVTHSGNVAYLVAGDLSVDGPMTVPGGLKLMAGWNGNIASPATTSETGTVTITGTTAAAGTISIEAGLGVGLVSAGTALSSTAGQTSIRTGSGGLALPPGTSISSSGFVELSPSGNNVDMCIYVGACAAEFSLDPSILSRIFPTGVLILGRPVADPSYTGKLTVLSDIPSSVINGSWLALNGYDVEIGAAASIGATGAGNAFEKPLDILANRNLTVTGNIVLGDTRDLAMNAGQSVNGLLDMNSGAALVYARNIALNNPRGAISGTTVLQTPPAGMLSANAYGGISLTGGNFVAGFTASNTVVGGITFVNTGDFNLGTVTNFAPGEPIAITGGGWISQIGDVIASGGAISVNASTNLTMSAGTKAQSYGGPIHYEAVGGSVQLGLLYAGAGSVNVVAGENITDGNGVANNIKAVFADLLASNADNGPGSIDVDTQVQSLMVNNDYVYDPGTISIRNSGSPIAVSVFSAPDTTQLTITNDNTINVGHIGGATNATLVATGGSSDITVAADTYGIATLLADGNIVVDAGRDILVMHDYVDAGGTVMATAGRNIRVASGGSGGFLPGLSYIQAANGINLTMLTGGLYVDGTASDAAYITTTSGDINVVASTGFTNSDVLGNGGKDVLDAPLGRWLIYAPNPATVVGAPAYNFKQYNTAFGGAIQGAGNGVIYTLAPTISAGLAGTVSKVYDGTNLATLTAANYGGLIGMVDGDTVAILGNAAAGTYDTKNVGGGKTVTVGGLGIVATNTTAAAFGGSAPVYGYLFDGSASGAIGAITPASLSVSGLKANDKVYDATAVATVSGTLGGLIAGDVVSLGTPIATFDNKNVGVAKPVSVSGITLAGADAGNYIFTPPVGVALTAKITPASLGVTGLSALDKVYDGTTKATLSGTFVGLFSGDVVAFAPGGGAFADRHVGTAKTVSPTGLALAGPDAGNYVASAASGGATASITQRPQVNWVGGTDNNWSTATNWAGGALPDRANVAVVNLGGAAVTYDYGSATADAAILAGLFGTGSLTLSGGTLTVTSGTLAIPTWVQTAGDLRGNGGLTVSQSMTMNGLGTIDIGGPVNISHNGNLSLGRIKTAGALSITATGSLSGTNAAGTWVQTADSIRLDAFNIGAANDILQTRTHDLTITNRGGNAWVFNTGLVNVTGSSVGGFHLEGLGGIVTGNSQLTAGGGIELIAHSPIVIGAGGVQGGAGVLLRASTPDASNSSILISGPVSAPGGAVVVAAYNDVTQNANITGNNVIVGSDSGSITMAATAQTQATGGNVSYKAPTGNMTLATINAGSGSVSLDAGGSISPAPGLTGANITGASAFINAGGSLELSTNVTLLDVDVGGNFAVSNGGTVFSSTPASTSGADQATKDLTNATDTALTDKTPTERSEAPPPPDTPKTDTSKPFSDPGKTTGGSDGTFGSEGDKPSTGTSKDEGGTKTASSGKDENGNDQKDEKDEKDKKDKKSDEAKDEKKDDKPVAKKIAQCT